MAKARRKPRKSTRRAPTRRRTPSARKSSRPKPTPKRSRPAQTKRRAAPPPSRIIRKPLPLLRTKPITRWRKGAKWVKAGTKGAERYDYIAQVSVKGKILRTIPISTPHIVTKFIAPGTIEEDHEVTGDIARSGHTQGLLRYHLQTINVMSSLSKKGVKMIEVTIKGRDTTEKTQRVKLLIEPEKQKDLGELLISRIITALRAQNLRTSYTLEMLKAAKHAGPLARRLSYQKFRELEPLHDLEVVVTIHR